MVDDGTGLKEILPEPSTCSGAVPEALPLTPASAPVFFHS